MNFADESLTPSTRFTTTLGTELARVLSPFQLITVHETHDFGRLMRLDGCNMTSEHDEWTYHEPMVHPALAFQTQPTRVLIVGGGDGGAAKEALKYRSVEHVCIAELDREVVNTAKQWLSAVHQGAFDDPRVEVRIGDAFQTLRESEHQFDLIVMDLTDPDESSGGLYSEAFYGCARDHLTPTGVLSTHLGSNFFHRARVENTLAQLSRVFPHIRTFESAIPIYGALWGIAHSSMHNFLDFLAQHLPSGLKTERDAFAVARRHSVIGHIPK